MKKLTVRAYVEGSTIFDVYVDDDDSEDEITSQIENEIPDAEAYACFGYEIINEENEEEE